MKRMPSKIESALFIDDVSGSMSPASSPIGRKAPLSGGTDIDAALDLSLGSLFVEDAVRPAPTIILMTDARPTFAK